MNRSFNLVANTCQRQIHAKKFDVCKQIHSSARSNTSSALCSHEEVQIPVPWGHIAGKWWGRKDVVPVVGLHGFEDNAGTFDRLVPLLKIPAFLALDAPGHGKSSHIPPGMVYTFIDFVTNLRRVVKYYGWQKFSIVGHSFGSTMGHIYSSLYPDEIDKFVSLDCARTLMATLGAVGLDGAPLLRKISEKSLKADKDVSKDPPAYTHKDIVEAFCKATYDSVLKEYADPLIARGVTEHPTKPNQFYFRRDQKLRFSDFNRPNVEILNESAKNIRCHVLTILGTEGFVNLAEGAVQSVTFNQLENIIKESAASYQRLLVKGSHHVHLNNPENVAPHINKFFDQ